MVASKPKPFKFGWFGDNGFGERLIQEILDGRKRVTACPDYDPVDADLVVGDTLELQDKHGKPRGLLVVTKIEKRPFGSFDQAVAAAAGVPLDDFRENLRYGNGRDLRDDEEMRLVYFQVVGTHRVKV